MCSSLKVNQCQVVKFESIDDRFWNQSKVANIIFLDNHFNYFFLPQKTTKKNQSIAIPDRLFEKIKGQNVVKFMRACKEINIAFIPYEEQV